MQPRSSLSAFDAVADDYDRVYGTNPVQAEAVDELVTALQPSAVVVDLGCGTGTPGHDTLTAAGIHVVGVDSSTEMLARARAAARPGAVYLHGDLRDVGVVPAPVDAVVAHFSLLLLSRADIAATLTAVHRLLRPGGWLSVAMVEFDGDQVPIDFLGTTITVSGYSAAGLRRLLEVTGYRVESFREYESVTADARTETQFFVTAIAVPEWQSE